MEAARPGPGRPSSGARERMLDAGMEVLKSEGYAGLTTAKVAARAGQNKALISYHFGSKQGLVAAVGRELSASITEELLGGLGDTSRVRFIVAGALDGLNRLMERDERLARLYFDLASVSVVDPEVRELMHEMKAGWRAVLADLLRGAEDGPRGRDADAAATFVLAGLDGLALQRLDHGETRTLGRAGDMFVEAVAAVATR
jgi:AcrR family transcriptional regulator